MMLSASKSTARRLVHADIERCVLRQSTQTVPRAEKKSCTCTKPWISPESWISDPYNASSCPVHPSLDSGESRVSNVMSSPRKSVSKVMITGSITYIKSYNNHKGNT